MRLKSGFLLQMRLYTPRYTRNCCYASVSAVIHSDAPTALYTTLSAPMRPTHLPSVHPMPLGAPTVPQPGPPASRWLLSALDPRSKRCARALYRLHEHGQGGVDAVPACVRERHNANRMGVCRNSRTMASRRHSLRVAMKNAARRRIGAMRLGIPLCMEKSCCYRTKYGE